MARRSRLRQSAGRGPQRQARRGRQLVRVQRHERPRDRRAAPAAVPAASEGGGAAWAPALSARSADALRDPAARYPSAWPQAAHSPTSHTANAGRTHFANRLAIAAATADDMRAALDAYVAGEAGASTRTGESAAAPEIAFLFTGPGAQYAGMGRELFETHPVFRAALERCDRILRGKLDTPLVDLLFASDPAVASKLTQTAFTQPALFAIEYALAQLWMSWGVKPSALIGHSVGEYVAAPRGRVHARGGP